MPTSSSRNGRALPSMMRAWSADRALVPMTPGLIVLEEIATMGAAPFITYQPGSDPAEAFHQACELARYQYGHDGYTGTIAEKYNYTVISATSYTLAEATELARRLIRTEDPRVDAPRGPAGAIAVNQATPAAVAEQAEPDGWLFFGWAKE